MSATAREMAEAVIWHDVECGGYDADLALWKALASERAGDVLELGSGTGRVALELAALGRRVAAVDTDAPLIDTLNARAEARGLDAHGLVADACDPVPPGPFALIAAPMQLIQLLPGQAERARLFENARARLVGGAVLAIAIVEGTPTAAMEESHDPPIPDVTERNGWVYSSLPLVVEADGPNMVVRRLRQRVGPDGNLDETVDETALAVVEASQLEAEARSWGLEPRERRDVPSTNDHIGSTVLILEASK